MGVFALAAPVTARAGWALLQSLAVFVVAVAAGLAVFVALVYLPALRLAGRAPLAFFRGVSGSLTIAFTATSTVAALPAMLDEAREHLKLSPGVASVVLPLGASLYRGGSALFQGAAVVFLAHVYAVPLPASALGGAVLATFLVSLTVAPVPSSGVMTLAPALDVVGIPAGGLALLLGVDRVPDMFRSAVNAAGQLTGAALVDARLARPAAVAAAD